MKIDNKEIKKKYNEYLHRNNNEIHNNCPSINEIINIFLMSRFSIKRKRLIKHIINCPQCIQVTKFLINIFKETDKISTNAYEIYKLRKINPANKNFRQISLFNSLKFSFPILAILAVLILVFFFIQNRSSSFRGSKFHQVFLISPINNTYKEKFPIFNWEASFKSDYFIIEIYDESLNLVWRSEKIFTTQYNLPQKIIVNLEKNKTYFWSVTAFLYDSKKIDSELGRFKLF